MESRELDGFSDWKHWCERTVGLAPKEPGVYVFRLAGAGRLPKLKGESDIVYVGWGESLQKRLSDHLTLRDDERDLGFRLKRVLEVPRGLAVAWKTLTSPKEARKYEAEFLEIYVADHIELPPLNRQETGKKDRQTEKTLRALTADELLETLRTRLPSEQRELLPISLSAEQHEALIAKLAGLPQRGSASGRKVNGGS